MQFLAGEVEVAADFVRAIRGQFNTAAQRFGLVFYIGQSHAAGGFAGTVEFGRVARREYPLQPPGGYETAGVLDGDLQAAVTGAADDGGGDGASCFDGFHGVGNQVVEDG